MALGLLALGLALGMYISCCLCQFHLRRAPNANWFFSGIWALVSGVGALRVAYMASDLFFKNLEQPVKHMLNDCRSFERLEKVY